MRRNDEEFKAELLLRVEKYKEHRKKQCRDALKAASVAMMVCVLVVSSRWGKLAALDWYRPLDETVADQTTAEDEIFAEDETVDMTESADVAMTEDNVEMVPETDSVQEDVTDVPAVTAGFSGVSIWEQKSQFNSAESSIQSNETKNYQDGAMAEALQEFLTERIETAKEIAEESITAEEPESGGASEESNLESVSSGKRYRFTIRYTDGRAIAYQVAEGKGELKIKGGCLILDQESWGKLMQIVGNTPKN